TDQVGNPIPGTYVYLEGFDVSENEILGENFTDNSGNFRVVSLKTSTNIFHVNRPEHSYFYYYEDNHIFHGAGSSDNSYTIVDYVDLSGSRNFGQVKLRKKAELLFKINKTSSTEDTLTWHLSYTHSACVYIFNNRGYLNQEASSCYENFSDDDFQQQDPSDPNFENTYQTIIGGTAEFIYQINDEPEQNILLNIDEIQETYVFEY
ncbi:MAG TPA: hypothetical protein VFM65_06105, partial [Flavobacteriaceae bacterium]|nr:hypothetical protein [Flavobacteriaceae bacterium]